mgnify:CR=1 FL=1
MLKEFLEVNVDDLILDQKNFRHDEKNSQEEIIRWFEEDQPEKQMNIAKDIAERGLNPLENIGVIESDDGFVVKEGNRRVSALKMLLNPTLCKNNKNRKKLESYASLGNIPTKIRVAVFDKYDSIKPFIGLLHSGEQEGKGRVPWDAMGISRFEEDTKGMSKYQEAIDILRFIHYEEKGFKNITNFQRFVTSSIVMNELGIAFNNRRLDNSSVSETAIKVLNVVAGEVSSGKLKVSEIDTIDNIRTYLSKIKKLVNVTSNETNTVENSFNNSSSIGNEANSSTPDNVSSEDESKHSKQRKPRMSVKKKPEIKRKKCNPNIVTIINELYRLSKGYENSIIALSRAVLECVMKYVVEDTKYKTKLLKNTTHFQSLYSAKDKKIFCEGLKNKLAEIIIDKKQRQSLQQFDLEKLHAVMHNPNITADLVLAENYRNQLMPIIEFLLDDETELLNNLDVSKLT